MLYETRRTTGHPRQSRSRVYIGPPKGSPFPRATKRPLARPSPRAGPLARPSPRAGPFEGGGGRRAWRASGALPRPPRALPRASGRPRGALPPRLPRPSSSVVAAAPRPPRPLPWALLGPLARPLQQCSVQKHAACSRLTNCTCVVGCCFDSLSQLGNSNTRYLKAPLLAQSSLRAPTKNKI